MKTNVIKEEYNFNDILLSISINKSNELCKSALIRLLLHINYMISLKTDVCYYPNKPKIIDDFLVLNITLQYHQDKIDEGFINKRIKEIKKLIETLEFNTNELKYIVRILQSYHIDPFNLIKISYSNNENLLIDEYCNIKLPQIIKPKIKEYYYPKLNFRHLEYIDPLMSDYGMYVNLSKPFKDMGYGYNYLHIYEHMMTCGWNDCDTSKQTLMNGCTYPTGMCYIYTHHSTQKSLKEHVIKYVKFHQKTKDIKYWNIDLLKELQRETKRTYSETQESKGLKEFARTDPSIFKTDLMIYDPNIFVKFSNDKYTLLTVSPNKIKFNFDKLELETDEKIKTITEIPKELTFDFIPLSALRNINKCSILKNFDVTKDLYDNNSCMFGVDCTGIYTIGVTDEIESLNKVLLYILNYDIKSIKKYLKSHVLPITNLEFGNIQLNEN